MMSKKIISVLFFIAFAENRSNVQIHASNIISVAASDSIRPNATMTVDYFNVSVTHRQNFCDIQKKIDKNETDIDTALNGLNIHVSLATDQAFVNVKGQGKDRFLEVDDPGVLVEILNKVAESGNFSWKNTFVFEDPTPTLSTGDDYLIQIIETYDVSINWWSETFNRISKGAAYPAPWYDNSPIIIEKKYDASTSRSSKFDFFNWNRPFTVDVWLAIVGTIIITGFFLYLIQEHLSQTADGATSRGMNVFECAYTISQCFMLFTGHFNVEPKTKSAQLLGISMAFFTLLIVSAYTANLVSFLVVENTVNNALQIESVTDIFRLQKSMCIFGGTSTQIQIQSLNSDAIFKKYPSDDESLLGLKNGECDYAILGKSGWDIFERKASINGACSLRRVGRDIINKDAGFVTSSDAGTKCTSLVRDVLNAHMKKIQTNGEFRKIWDAFLDKQGTLNPECVVVNDETELDNMTLNMTNLGSIFTLHYAFLFIAFTMSLFSYYYKHNGKKELPYSRTGNSLIETENLNLIIEPLTKEVKDVSIALKEAMNMFEELKNKIDRLEESIKSSPD